MTSAATYTLVPARSVVRVAVDVTARNDKPNLVSGGVGRATSTTASGSGSSPRPPSIRATADGATVGTTTRPQDGYSELEVRFRLVALLPPGRRRSASRSTCRAVRRGRRARSGSGRPSRRSPPGRSATAGSVRIVVPAGFEAETSGSDVDRSTANRRHGLHRRERDRRPVVVRRRQRRSPDRPHQRPDRPAGRRAPRHPRLAGGPDVATRRDRAPHDGPARSSSRRRGSTGRCGDLDVFEVHTPLLEGYAGIFYEGENRIEISEDLDDLTILHEASHAWFNQRPVRRTLDQRGVRRHVTPSRTLDAVGLGGWAPNAGQPDDSGGGPARRLDLPGPDHRRRDRRPRGIRLRRGVDGRPHDRRPRSGPTGCATCSRARRGSPDRLRRRGHAGDGRRATDWRRLLDLLDERRRVDGPPTTSSGAGS